MPRQIRVIQKRAFGFAVRFLGVYSLDYVPGIMDKNGLMFGLFHMSRLIDLGHLGAGSLALISALVSAKLARIYFWILGIRCTIDVLTYFFGHLHSLSLTTNVLVNLPHILVSITAYWIALRVEKPNAAAAAACTGAAAARRHRGGATLRLLIPGRRATGTRAYPAQLCLASLHAGACSERSRRVSPW
jgi:hypothetical protein